MARQTWKPESMTQFVEDYLGGMEDFDLAKAHDGTRDQVQKLIRKLRTEENLPSRTDLKETEEKPTFEYQGLREKQEFREFLLSARTRLEIEDKFGPSTDTLLADTYSDLNLFQQLNDYGQPIYILLPAMDRDDLVIKKREWTFYQAQSQEGDFVQPYQLVQLPDALFKSGEVIIAPLYDVHWGHFACKREKLLAYLRWIEETPNVLTLIGGDLMENALDDGRGFSYSQDTPPDTQINEICKLLAPIAHKILFALPGNHEARTHKKAGIDLMKIVAQTLDVPSYTGPVYCSILGMGYKWKIYAFHGSCSGQTKGGKLNAAGRPRVFTDGVQFFLSGHTHDPVIASETCITEDPANCRLVYKTQWTVVAPSFMHWENSYAYSAGYPPPGKGGVAIRLFANGDYDARLRDKG